MGRRSRGRSSSEAASRPSRRLSFWQELPLLVVLALALALIVKSFAFQAFFIPSGSMERTLHGCEGCQGDRVVVNKLGYDFRAIARGDVVVFDGKDNYPPKAAQGESGNPVTRRIHQLADFVGLAPSGTDYIKRVIGLPGDVVQCCDDRGRVMVNGVALDEPYVFVDPGQPESRKSFGPVTVPAHRLWVMGDHRNASTDSRFVGAVPERDVIGRAFVVVWPPSRVGLLPRTR